MKNINQKGQTLLIAIMLLATALTVVLAVSFRSTTETSLTKLEEEHQKALAAAEAGIQAALQKGNTNLASLNVPTGFTGNASVSTTTKTTFVSPLLQKDEQYTFYLTSPGGSVDDPNFANLTSNSAFSNLPLTICFGSSTSAPALDISLIRSDKVIKYAVNPISPAYNPINPTNPTGPIITGSNVSTAASPAANDCPSSTVPFTNKFNIPPADVGSASLLLVVHVLSPSPISTYLGLQSTGGNLPFQGRTIVSNAHSPGGVSTTVQLFQSYPQIPSDFFVTSF